MSDGPVRPPVSLLTELDAREILAKPLLKLCSDQGPTRVGKSLGGVDEKTIRNARDEKSTLGLETAVNLLALDGSALDGFLAHFGRTSIAIGDKPACGRTLQTKLAKLMLEVSIAMEDGEISEHEAAAMKKSLDAAGEAIDAMRRAA